MNRSTAPRVFRMATLALAVLAVAMATGGVALAQDAAAPAPGAPPSVDTDGNGVLSPAEHSAASRGAFQRMDADRDGRITVAEMGAMPGSNAAGMPWQAGYPELRPTIGEGLLAAAGPPRDTNARLPQALVPAYADPALTGVP